MDEREDLKILVAKWLDQFPKSWLPKGSHDSKVAHMCELIEDLRSHGYTYEELKTGPYYRHIIDKCHNPDWDKAAKKAEWRRKVEDSWLAALAREFGDEIDAKRKKPLEPKIYTEEDVKKAAEIPNTLENPLDFSKLGNSDFPVIYDDEFDKLLGIKNE